MLDDLARRLRYRWRRLTKPPTVRLHGLTIRVDHPLIRDMAKSFYKETYERGEVALLSAVLRPGDRVIDIGSGIGLTAMFAARAVGPSGAVLGFEANPEALALARAQAEANGCAIEFRNALLVSDPDAPATLPFHLHPRFISSTARADRPGAMREIALPTVPLPPLLAEFRPSVLSIDIEGFEVDLLSGLNDFGPVRAIVMETHAAVTGAAALATLEAHLAAAGFTRPADLVRGDTAAWLREAPC
ncbi:MAG: FkbM family methyltransferase [Pseudomonadota bacterium]